MSALVIAFAVIREELEWRPIDPHEKYAMLNALSIIRDTLAGMEAK